MTDIVERLRHSVTKGQEPTDDLAIEAADEIERLRAALSIARGAMVGLRDGAQADKNFGAASLIQTHINILDRANEQSKSRG